MKALGALVHVQTAAHIQSHCHVVAQRRQTAMHCEVDEVSWPGPLSGSGRVGRCFDCTVLRGWLSAWLLE